MKKTTKTVKQPKAGRGLLVEPQKPTNEESSLVNLAVEKGWSYDSTGKAVGSVIGSRDRIENIPADLLAPGSTFTHSHPSGASFSADDLFTTAINDLREMRAIGSSGRLRTFLYRFWFKPGLSLNQKLEVVSRYDDIKTIIYAEAKLTIRLGRMTASNFDRNREHMVMERLKSVLPDSLEYERIPLS